MYRNGCTSKQIGPLNYSSALDELRGNKFKKIYNNTCLFHQKDGSVSLVFHDTEIIVYHPDGSITLNSGCWRTKMTKSRINAYLENINITTVDGSWTVNNGGDFFYEFENNMTISSDGKITTRPIGYHIVGDVTHKKIDSLETMIEAIKNADTKTLNRLWRKSLTKIYIAYYASLEFLALVAASATGCSQQIIKQRFQNGV